MRSFFIFVLLPALAFRKEEINFEDLVARANCYQLPKPPAGGKLILANTGTATGLNSVTFLEQGA